MSSEPPPFNHELLRHLFDQAPTGLAHVGLDGRLLRANRWFCNVLGYTHDELLARALDDLVDPEDVDIGLAQERQLLAGRLVSYTIERRFLRKDGSLIWAQQTVSLLRDAHGHPDSLLTTIFDVSERKRAERELKDSETRVRAILDQAPLGIVFFDSHLRYERINAYSARVTGHKPDDLIGRPLEQVLRETFGSEAADQVLPRFVNTLETGEPFSVRAWSGKLFNQGEKDYYSSWEIRRVKHNHVPIGVLLTFVDITEFELARRELAQSQATLQAIVQTAADGIITIDQQGTIVSVNAAANALFGYAPGELEGKPVGILTPPAIEQVHPQYIKEYMRTGKGKVIGTINELVARRKNGSSFPIELAVSEVRLPDGNRLFTGIVHDISRRRELEKQILHVSESEQARIGQDLHDGICQELAAATMAINLLASKMEEKSQPDAKEARQIMSDLRTINTHVRDLAHGLYPVRLAHGGLSAALEELTAQLTRHTAVPCSCACDDQARIKDPTTAVHLYRIAQEAMNNAIRHGKAGHIAVALQRNEQRICLKISDDGIGITSGALRSAGMGIRTMKYRANVIGASLEIHAGANGGTDVACCLPLSPPPDMKNENVPPKPERKPRSRQAKKNPGGG